MRDINLLPRKDRLRQYFVLLLVVILFFCALAIAVQSYYKYDINRETDKLGAELAFVEAQIESQRQKFIPDERTVEYNRVSAEVERMEEFRRQWLSHLVYILGYLPDEAMVAQMGVDNNALLTAEIHFATVQQLLRFLERLQAEPQFQSLKVEQLGKMFEEQAEPDNVEVPSPDTSEKQDYEDFILQLFIESLRMNEADLSVYDQQSELEQALRASEQSLEPSAGGLAPFLFGDSPYTVSELTKALQGLKPIEQETSDEPEQSDAPRKYRTPFVGDYYKLAFNIQLDPYAGRKAGD